MENRRNILILDMQGMVAEFMRASGQPVRKRPTNLTMEEAQLRHSLYMEEVDELSLAIQNGDRVEQLDALADILYIVYGTANTEGHDTSEGLITALKMESTYILGSGRGAVEEALELENIAVRAQAREVPRLVYRIGNELGFDVNTVTRAFGLVHVSNMSKFCTSEAEANETVASYKHQGVGAFWAKQGDLYVVYRTEDKKVLKSINYRPVSLKELIN